MRFVVYLVSLMLAVILGALGAMHFGGQQADPVPVPATIVRVREVLRLEVLEVNLYKKIAFNPQPEPAGSVWGDLSSWIRESLSPSQGRAIVFARVGLLFDLAQIDEGHVRVHDREVWVLLPELSARVELLPDETEIIASNLDAAQTARLFELARDGFARDVMASRDLQKRARHSARLSLTVLLTELGFSQVHVVEKAADLPGQG